MIGVKPKRKWEAGNFVVLDAGEDLTVDPLRCDQ
jgi:hypothetical protein